MSNEITLKPVNELLGESYFIPSYQRGYRWTKSEVRALLSDINEFRQDSAQEEASFYCLQPLIIRPIEHGEKRCYEVIDGQQRLTTIALVVQYANEQWLGKKKHALPLLDYETREGSATFLRSLEFDDYGMLNLEKLPYSPKDNIDYYHMAEAYKEINQWVTEQGSSFNNNDFLSKFIHHTKVIWYEINEEEKDSIRVFERNNIGKIPLRDAELIKAFLLNFLADDELRSKERKQVELARRWDEIENRLQTEEFWAFLFPQHLSHCDVRIEALFCLILGISPNLLGQYDPHHKIFIKLQERLQKKSAEELWREVEDCYNALSVWYEDKKWFHYIGFLMHTRVDSIEGISNTYRNAQSKGAFTEYLLERIQAHMQDAFDEQDKPQWTYDDNAPNIRRLLLLYNVQLYIQHQDYKRFSFATYQKERWDIEHIDSIKARELETASEQQEWVRCIIQDLGASLNDNPALLKRSEDFVRNPRPMPGDYDKLYRELSKLTGEIFLEEEETDPLHHLGNLTLLPAKLNRGYKNAPFASKRAQVRSYAKNNSFIPLGTEYVFMKYFDGHSKTFVGWNHEDKRAYACDIQETLIRAQFILNRKQKRSKS